jgi:hypothetical protein
LALAVRPDCVAGLLVISGGEALDRDLAEQLLGRDATLWNAYGPTETAIVATCHEVTRLDPGPVPIGVPIEGTTAFVLEQYGVDRPIDTPDELWIGGAGVGIGYAREPELTAAAFVNDPVRGRLYRTGDVVYRDAAGRLQHAPVPHGRGTPMAGQCTWQDRPARASRRAGRPRGTGRPDCRFSIDPALSLNDLAPHVAPARAVTTTRESGCDLYLALSAHRSCARPAGGTGQIARVDFYRQET